MRRSLTCVTLGLLCLSAGQAMADDTLRQVLSSGATTASTYVTFKDNKLIVAAQDDAGAYIASGGEIRGSYLEAAMQRVRSDNPGLQASDAELAQAILIAEPDVAAR
ncbi:DUF2388 domain-containing protein [Pseudomonas sp. PDM14]|uniref:DUF2388 domain-containing protein n=1 Tax=Pseudomonas sp. PDM14 TaxID=2769288 RepID=UPI0017837975|nr:DUF2388 domain-containing protein [Pseudomonas sp. PDM14]MBD9483026.1 DUF2388 domain-containing protein [Pseudomonas sp. PDM14]